jgi:hypothetical protein
MPNHLNFKVTTQGETARGLAAEEGNLTATGEEKTAFLLLAAKI